MTARVFLAVPDGSVLSGAVSCSTVLILCRVVLLKRPGHLRHLILYFDLVWSGSRWRCAPFDTSSWAIWRDKETSTKKHDPWSREGALGLGQVSQLQSLSLLQSSPVAADL